MNNMIAFYILCTGILLGVLLSASIVWHVTKTYKHNNGKD